MHLEAELSSLEAELSILRCLTLLVPGVDSSHVPGFFREFVFYAIMAKLLEITPINHIFGKVIT
jgi:hypothetical protein